MDSRLELIMLKISKVIRRIADRVERLEKIAHPPRKFVNCETCKGKIREKNGKKR